MALSYKDITGIYKFDHITLAGFLYVNNWKLYADKIGPSVSDIMAMDTASWEGVDSNILRINHEFK